MIVPCVFCRNHGMGGCQPSLGWRDWKGDDCNCICHDVISREFVEITKDKRKELERFFMSAVLSQEAMTELKKKFPVLEFFTFGELIDGVIQNSGRECHDIAWSMAQKETKRPAEMAAGLRKLLEARDCFIRAVLPQ